MRKKRHASRFRWDGPPSERERGEETSVSTSEHGGFSLALEVKRAERVWEERECVCVCVTLVPGKAEGCRINRLHA